MKITKTLQIDLLEPSEKKKRVLKKSMNQFDKVREETAKRLPSAGNKAKYPKKWSFFYEWWKEFRDKYDLELYAQTGQQAVHSACASFVSIRENNNYNEIPRFKDASVIEFHNQQIEFKRKEGRIYFKAPALKGHKILLPLKGKRYQYKFLKQIEKGDLEHGSAEIKKYCDSDYKLNLTIKFEIENFNEEYDTRIGVDLGLDNISTLVIIKNGEVEDTRFWSGGKAADRKRKYWDKKEELQRKGLKKKIKERKGKLERWKKNLDHNISREIVNIAEKYENPVIIFEELEGVRNASKGLKGEAKKKQNRMLSSWTFFRLKQFTEYKAKEVGIPIMEVDAKNTSKKCSNCGSLNTERPYNDNYSLFRCNDCGYEVNADFNGANNIASAEEN